MHTNSYMRQRFNFNTAFTLIELLIVIGILAILLAITIVALNPQKQFYEVNTTKVQSNLKAIRSALYQCYLDHMQDGKIAQYCYTGTPSSAWNDIARGPAPTGVTYTSTIDICPLITNGYLPKIPVNTMFPDTVPQGDNIDSTYCQGPANYYTGFQAYGLTPPDPQQLKLQTALPGLAGTPEFAQMSAEGYAISNSPQTSGTQYRLVKANDTHTCAIGLDNKVYCWGVNTNGQGATGNNISPLHSPTLALNGSTIKSLSTGTESYHSCAIDGNDHIICWGYNNNGQLGDGTYTNANSPVAIQYNGAFKQVSVGSNHTCAIRSDDKLMCWGLNNNGQLGDGSTTMYNSPQLISNTLTFKKVSAGPYNTCGILSNDKVMCWGYNAFGEVGDGTIQTRLIPTSITDNTSYADIQVGMMSTCGLRLDGTVTCWGRNDAGQLGDGTANNASTPQVITGLNLKQLSAGEAHVCGISTTNKLMCWGANWSGQLGDGTTNVATTPIEIVTPYVFSQVSAGADHTCGLRTDNKIMCWGNNYAWQLGNNAASNNSVLTPDIVSEPQ